MAKLLALLRVPPTRPRRAVESITSEPERWAGAERRIKDRLFMLKVPAVTVNVPLARISMFVELPNVTVLPMLLTVKL